MVDSELATLQRNDPLLRLAIADKRLLQFRYDSNPRVAEPHDYGIQGGSTRLQAYQLRGPARAGKNVVGWRNFQVSRMEDCVVLEQTFPGSRGRFHETHRKWDILYARVE
jgi:predicted DNA-binding transcriptional regulator YafY